MAKYLFLKHYRGAPASVNDVPMDQWTPAEIEAHIQYMEDFADRLQRHAASTSTARPWRPRAPGSAHDGAGQAPGD